MFESWRLVRYHFWSQGESDSWIRSDEVLVLQTSALETLHVVKVIVSTQIFVFSTPPFFIFLF